MDEWIDTGLIFNLFLFFWKFLQKCPLEYKMKGLLSGVPRINSGGSAVYSRH